MKVEASAVILQKSKKLVIQLVAFVLPAFLLTITPQQQARADVISKHKKIFLRQHCKHDPSYTCKLNSIIIILK